MKYSLSELASIIQDRRTIFPENYSTRKVQKEMVEKMLNNAIWAPTHGNTQPWRFKVFMNGGLQKLSAFLGNSYVATTNTESFVQGKYEKLTTRALQASVAIAIVMKRDETGRISEVDEIAAVACAVQNIHLTCSAYGLGGFWSTPGFLTKPSTNEFLNIGEKDKCLGIFYIGYPNGEWPKGQRKPIEYVTEWIEE
jgi:nitroreductase